MIVFVNGQFDPKLSGVAELPAFLTYQKTAEGHTLEVQDNSEIALHFLSAKQDALCQHRIVVGKNSRVTLFDEYQFTEMAHESTRISSHITVENAATLNYYKIQNENLHVAHTSETQVLQKQHSIVNTYVLSLGSLSANEKLHIYLQEPGAMCYATGLYFTHQDNQQIQHAIQIDHQAPQCTSEMIYKGLAKQKSQARFAGKILVHKNAVKTSAKQTNQNLTLSNQAEIQAKPELEIYADDVKCAHGNTVGQIDEEALFYLRSRGIEKNTAMVLLTQAFVDEVIQRVTNPAIKQMMQTLLNEKMEKTH